MPTPLNNFIASAIGLALSLGVVFVSIHSQQTPLALALSGSATATSTAADTGTQSDVGFPSAQQGQSTPQAATPSTAATQPAAQQQTQPKTVASSKTSGYKNGSYTAQSYYRTPGGTDGISVTLDLEDGVVTGAAVSNTPGSRESERFQSAFSAGYRQYVIGKKISSLNVSRISGASLTTYGFMDAVSQIRSEASA